jgi:hypothetical protein
VIVSSAADTIASQQMPPEEGEVPRIVAEPPPLTDEEGALADDIADAIERRLGKLGLDASRPVRDNVSFVVDCRKRFKERQWNRARQRRVCAALERRYLAAGWRYASIYVMEHDHLRLRVTLRSRPPARGAVRG